MLRWILLGILADPAVSYVLGRVLVVFVWPDLGSALTGQLIVLTLDPCRAPIEFLSVSCRLPSLPSSIGFNFDSSATPGPHRARLGHIMGTSAATTQTSDVLTDSDGISFGRLLDSYRVDAFYAFSD